MSAQESSHPDFESEQAFLHHARDCLEQMRLRTERRGDAGGDPKASFALEEQRRRALERMGDPHSICFGRLDFEVGDEHYVGRQMIENERGELVVINWAAPAAGPFYEATPEEPMGLSLRRRFRTEGVTLLGISDDLFGETAVAEPAFDDILLAELTRERTAEMREIAATIQQDQYRIISRPHDSTTVVQGGPGTGKTAVGLHRAALLLYRHRAELGAGRVLVVGPNPLFMQYIAYVLPSLGETNAVQVAVDGLGSVTGVDRDDVLVARVKGDERMAEVLKRAIVDRVRLPREPARFEAHAIKFVLTPAQIAELVGDFDPTETPFASARNQFLGDFERRVESAYAEARTAMDARSAPEAINAKSLPDVERALDRIWPSITAPELVRQLLSSDERLESAGSTSLTSAERRLLYRKPVERLELVRWTAADVPLVDEVQHLIDRTVQRAGHLVLDEAQDLTPMQLRMVGRRIRDGSVTVLGDLAQATGLWEYSNWSEITRHLGLMNPEVEELTLAYRVPREIMELALPVLELTAPSILPPVAFRPGGEKPTFSSVSRAERARYAVDTAVAAHAAGGRAAIIGPRSCLPELRVELERRGIEFGDSDRGELSATVDLLDPVASKGLEFDHVILVEPAAVIREASDRRGHQELYVALTRAMRTLACFHSEPLPWPLGQVDRPSVPEPVAAPEDPAIEQVESLNGGSDAPRISLGEAFILASLRGMEAERSLARALLVAANGGKEEEVASAVLVGDLTDAAIDALLAKARALSNGRESDV